MKPSILDTGLRYDLVRHVSNFGHSPSQDCRFQAVVGIQMQVKRRSRYLVMVMLSLHQPSRQGTLVVLVHVDNASDAFHILLSFDLLAGKELPDSIAHTFGSVGVAFGLEEQIEVRQQIVIDGNSYALHVVLIFRCAEPGKLRMMI